MNNPESLSKLWPRFFWLAAIEGAVALAALLSIPSEGGRFGFSFARLALLGLLLAFCVLWIVCALRAGRLVDRLSALVSVRSIWLSALLVLTLSLLLFLLRYLDPERLLPVYQRLSPLLFYLLALSVQAGFFLLFLKKGIHPESLAARKPLLFPALTVFTVLALTFLFIAVTRLGLTPDPAYWGESGVPVQGWQFVLALLGGTVTLLISLLWPKPSRLLSFLPLFIWLVAVIVWLSVPVDTVKNSFYVSIDPPAFQPFPYSDAGYYDVMAQSLLIGYPYQGEIPTRPLYIVLLAFLHLLFGQNYNLMIAGQTLILAFIPVVLYWLGTKLHSRTAGVIAALLFIFREWTTLLVSSATRVSNTKTLLVDLPTLLLILLVCYFVLRWLEKKDAQNALVAGGTFGLLLLLRTQSALLLPMILLFAALVLLRFPRSRNTKLRGFWADSKPFLLLSSVFIVGLIVTVAPWLAHNYLASGHFTFDAPFQYKVLASQYAYTGNLDIRNLNLEGKSLGQILLQFMLADPGFVFGFIANHFLAGQIGGMLALPLIESYNGLFAPLNLYWLKFDGHLAWYNVTLILVYAAVIALGIGASWKRWRWLGLLPLGFNLAYVLATAIGRFSGWRYDLPADWVPYFYFAIGFSEFLFASAALFGVKGADEQNPNMGMPERQDLHLSPRLAAFGLLFIFIGSLPWLATRLAPPRYADQAPSALATKIASLPGAPALGEIRSFTTQPGTVIQIGELLYPRYYYRGVGLSSANAWPSYAVRDFPRMGFLLLDQARLEALFRTKDPLPFPQGADAIILGCQREDYIDVRLIAFPTANKFYLSAPLSQPCD